MMRLLGWLFVGLLFEAVGVVFLSKGMKQLMPLRFDSWSGLGAWLGTAATQKYLLIGVGLEAVFFSILLLLLARAEVSWVWPLTALSFVFTAISAKLFLHEHVSTTRWCGIALIVVGASLVSWSERTPGPAVLPGVEANQNSGSPDP